MTSKKREISDRQAFKYIEKAMEDGKLSKIKLGSDVLYGLPNWAFPDTSSKRQEEALTFQDAFKYRCFKRLEYLSNLSLHKPENTLLLLGNLIAMLPTPQREKLEPIYQAASKAVAKIQKEDAWGEMQYKIRDIVRQLIGEVSKVLHES